MGKRKVKRKPPPKVKSIVPLETQFNCPFCNHERMGVLSTEKNIQCDFVVEGCVILI
ncbi:hypothetical protein WUBG_16111 [Wuchereria bancrofti]|uniref:Transcription elongation factor 1 homolog n=1 Tax=Wuchereria bancrofti TaxID=6293 RepID=J9EC46_WUCBA|nr:hypothetical protein WUBG_16111 [Wuchereria bancrofti]